MLRAVIAQITEDFDDQGQHPKRKSFWELPGDRLDTVSAIAFLQSCLLMQRTVTESNILFLFSKQVTAYKSIFRVR